MGYIEEAKQDFKKIRDIRPNVVLEGILSQKHFESLREEKARVLCEDKKSGVILPCLCKILQGGRKKEARASSAK